MAASVDLRELIVDRPDDKAPQEEPTSASGHAIR